MPATKSGSSIIIDGSPNTLSSVTADINDITWIEESPAGTFTIKSKITDIQDGGVLTIGDSGDYSVQETLMLEPSGNDTCRIYIRAGGEFQQFGDTKIYWTHAAETYFNILYHYGKSYIRGNVTYKPTWYRLSSLRFTGRDYKTQAERNHDIVDWEYVKWEDPRAADARGFYWDYYMYYWPDPGLWKVKNCEFGKVGDAWANFVYQYANTAFYSDCSMLTFEDCLFSYGQYATYLYGMNPYFKNCTFDNCYSAGYVVRPSIGGRFLQYRRDERFEFPQQRFTFYDGCTIQNGTAPYEMAVSQGGVVLLRDCAFNRSDSNLKADAAASTFYIWTGNTFAGSSGYGGIVIIDQRDFAKVFWVHSLDLTIKDKGENPIEGATIMIRQKNGEDDWIFYTGANGKPKSIVPLAGKIMLKHKQLYIDSGYQVEFLSDASNSTYHDVWVWKEGYEPAKLTYIMNQDRTVTVQLETALTVPDVRDTVPFGLGLAGELDLPTIGDVEKGVQFDSATKTGTFKVPPEAKVEKNYEYGEDDVEFTGQMQTMNAKIPIIGTLQPQVSITGKLRKAS